MFPYIKIFGNNIYMTGIGIVSSFIFFILIVRYLTKKYKQNFWKFFYRLPILIFSTYILGSYTDFFLNISIIPHNYNDLLMILTPYDYKFHFIGILLGSVISFQIFFKKLKNYETKKLRGDIFFYAIALSLIPLGFFLLLGDNFIGNPTNGPLAVKRLIEDSELRKFSSVYPIGIFISIGSLLITVFISILKKYKKKIGFGMLGIALLIIMLNIVFLYQQYPRHGLISLGNINFDIKQHVSFLIIMLCLYIYNKRNRYTS